MVEESCEKFELLGGNGVLDAGIASPGDVTENDKFPTTTPPTEKWSQALSPPGARVVKSSEYDASFKQLWGALSLKGIAPEVATIEQLADGIIQLFHISQATARNAYSACMLFPAFSPLRTLLVLKPYKKQWNTSVEKYASFWDAMPLVHSLAKKAPTSLLDLRNRLIIACRLFCLHRSIDLCRTLRSVSIVGETPFIQIKRKGWKTFKWEQLVSIPSLPHLSPWHLIQQYVAQTAHQGKEGGPLLLAISPPYKPYRQIL